MDSKEQCAATSKEFLLGIQFILAWSGLSSRFQRVKACSIASTATVVTGQRDDDLAKSSSNWPVRKATTKPGGTGLRARAISQNLLMGTAHLHAGHLRQEHGPSRFERGNGKLEPLDDEV